MYDGGARAVNWKRQTKTRATARVFSGPLLFQPLAWITPLITFTFSPMRHVGTVADG
jgi:hypothetical protein